MRKNFKQISLMLSLVLCLAAMAFGQSTTGSIEGELKDAQGAVLPGATVSVKSTGTTTGYSRTVTTGDNGYFIIPNVPVGNYEVTVTKTGFADQKVTVTVTLDRSARVDTALAVGGTTANVEVTSDENITIDPSESKLQTNITSQLFNALPKGTTFTSLLKAAPNVRPESLSGGFQVDGASGSENVFIIDGQEVTNFRTGLLNANNNLPFELIQEVQIKSTGFEAEYGGATGGVVTVVTQGGNDQWHGNFGASFTPQKLQGVPHSRQNRFSNASANFGFTPGFEYYKIERNGGVGFFPVAKINGPILKGKVWFSAIYAPQINELSSNVPFYTSPNGSTLDPLGRFTPSADPATRVKRDTQTFNFKRITQEAFVRLDAQPIQKLRLFGSFLWNPIIDEGYASVGTNLGINAYGLTNFSTVNPGGRVGTQADLLNSQGGRQNSNSVNMQATLTPTNNTVVNVRFGRSFLNEKLGSYNIPNITQYQCSTSSFFTGEAGINAPSGQSVTPAQAGCIRGFVDFPSNYQIAYDVSTRRTFDADAAFVGINLLGRHNFKFGYQYNGIFNTTDQGYRDTGTVILGYGRNCANIGGGYTGSVDATAVGCGYIQRFGTKGSASSASNSLFVQDSWQIASRLTLNIGVRGEVEDVPSFVAANPGIHFGWGDKIAPRFGVSFDVLGNAKLKAFASYGWFYDRFKYELPRGSFGGDFYRRDWFDITPARGLSYSNYTYANILGSHPDPIGGEGCVGAIIRPGAYSICQVDFRISSNSGAGLVNGAVDPDLKAARQSEYTFGLEYQLMKNLIVSGRYSHKNVDRAVEDVGAVNATGSEAYVIGNPGFGLACEVATSFGTPCTKAQRKYDAVEIRADKRLSNHFFFNASYTWSRLFGNYSGLASSDELTGSAGRTSPNVSRYFDLPFEPYTIAGQANNGLLATDRPHVFKAYGGYDYEWSKSNTTAISFFTTAQSGTPLTSYITYLGIPIVFDKRGDLGRTKPVYTTDLGIDHKYRFGRDDRVIFQPYVNILNLFDRQSEITRQNLVSLDSISNTLLRQGNCPATLCTGGLAPYTLLFQAGGGAAVQAAIKNYLLGWNATRPIAQGGPLLMPDATNAAARQLNTYNTPTNWTTPREIRFGARLFF